MPSNSLPCRPSINRGRMNPDMTTSTYQSQLAEMLRAMALSRPAERAFTELGVGGGGIGSTRLDILVLTIFLPGDGVERIEMAGLQHLPPLFIQRNFVARLKAHSVAENVMLDRTIIQGL